MFAPFLGDGGADEVTPNQFPSRQLANWTTT